MGNEYDAIVVGARCAGAPTAMLLARKGYKVLMVDRASFPSDTDVHPPDPCPRASPRCTLGAARRRGGDGLPGDRALLVRLRPGRRSPGNPSPTDGIGVAYAPRRTVLDNILVEAAVDGRRGALGAFHVDELLIEDGVVVGSARPPRPRRHRRRPSTRSSSAPTARNSLVARPSSAAVQREADAAVLATTRTGAISTSTACRPRSGLIAAGPRSRPTTT